MKPRQLHLSRLGMERSAIISDCGRYRYRLARRWGPGWCVTWVMLNPSIADGERDDHTIRKCLGFARRWGYGAIEVVNLFAWRATVPAELFAAVRLGQDVVGPENDRHIRQALAVSTMVVAAWGAHSATRLDDRDDLVRGMLDEPMCLGQGIRGGPRHPLMVSYSAKLVPFPSRAMNQGVGT